MCGRYAFDDIEEIYEVRALLEEAAENVGSETASQIKTGEVFPSETCAVVAQGVGATAMNWGYPMSNTKRIIINARSETIFSKPMFRGSVINRKCLIPCTGFYEWKKETHGNQKYKINPVGEEFFYLAGIYNTFRTEGIHQKRFVIITAEANESMQDIHTRMPLIVPKQNAEAWINSNVIDIDNIYKMTGELSKVAV